MRRCSSRRALHSPSLIAQPVRFQGCLTSTYQVGYNVPIHPGTHQNRTRQPPLVMAANDAPQPVKLSLPLVSPSPSSPMATFPPSSSVAHFLLLLRSEANPKFPLPRSINSPSSKSSAPKMNSSFSHGASALCACSPTYCTPTTQPGTT